MGSGTDGPLLTGQFSQNCPWSRHATCHGWTTHTSLLTNQNRNLGHIKLLQGAPQHLDYLVGCNGCNLGTDGVQINLWGATHKLTCTHRFYKRFDKWPGGQRTWGSRSKVTWIKVKATLAKVKKRFQTKAGGLTSMASCLICVKNFTIHFAFKNNL